MKRFKVIKNGVCTNQWTEDVAGEDHYEPCFGEPGTYELVVEDITAEIQARLQKKADEVSSKDMVKKLKKGDLQSFDDVEKALIQFAKALGMK